MTDEERQAYADHRREQQRGPNRKRIIKQYGLTVEERDRIWKAQGECCAVCSHDEGVMTHDHNHYTGKFRGIICQRCNTALGMALDDPATLRALADYLDRNN